MESPELALGGNFPEKKYEESASEGIITFQFADSRSR